MSIYETGRGTKLFDVATFGAAVTTYRSAEERTLRAWMSTCAVVVEFGCFEGQHARLVLSEGIRYVGVDPSGPYIEAARRNFKHVDADRCVFVQAHAEDVARWCETLRPGERALFFMPFNCIGNVDDPAAVLSAFASVDAAVLISYFTDTPQASAAREAYYRRAHFEVTRRTTAWGVEFTDISGWRTTGFGPALKTAAEAVGMRVSEKDLGAVGRALVGRTQRSEERPAIGGEGSSS